jgi:hypothetical protein
MTDKNNINILLVIFVVLVVLSLFCIAVVYSVGLFTPSAIVPVTTNVPLATEVPVVTVPTTCEPIVNPGVFINPIGNVTKGTPTLRISGVTSVEVGSAVSVYVMCDNYHITGKAMESGNIVPYNRDLSTLVVGSECGLHQWSVDVDTAGLISGLYYVYVMTSERGEGYSNIATFYVVDGVS